MKKSAHILGLPIISITEGRELGISKSLLMDAKNGMIAAIIIEDEDWYRGVKVLPYTSVTAIGDDAITIISSENILQVAEATEYEPLLTANVRIIGTKAITKGGTIHGIVDEIVIDESGKVAVIEIKTKTGGISEVSAEQVSIFGKQVTIIDSDIPSAKADESEAVHEVKAEAAPAPVAAAPAPEAAPQPAAVEPAAQPKIAPVQQKQQLDKAAEERHRRFLLGKKANRRIATDNGIVIVEAGGDITEEVLQKAKLANKFVELSMNIQ